MRRNPYDDMPEINIDSAKIIAWTVGIGLAIALVLIIAKAVGA